MLYVFATRPAYLHEHMHMYTEQQGETESTVHSQDLHGVLSMQIELFSLELCEY